MITEGFAFLDPVGSRQAGSTYAPKQKLSEPIVVDAVIEYLRDMESDDEDNLESVLRNFLFDNQDDASSFGKAAEYYFAWSLGGLFARSSDGLDLSINAREKFRKRIAQAKFIPTDSHIGTEGRRLGTIQGYDRYILEEPSPELKSDITLGSTITFPEWLYRVKHEEFFPTFHFPSTHAGPDIVFCLKSQVTGERILCAFQIKTGEKCDKSDAFKLVRTLDPSLWFWTAPNLRKDLNNELERWKSHRILTALVITSRPCIDFFASESDLYNGMIQVQQHIQKWKSCRELSRKIEDSGECDPTAFAGAVIREGENAKKEIENAASSIYKAPRKRKDKEAEPNDIPMPDHDNCRVPLPNDCGTDGYYFVILDNIALKSFLGPTFFHLCKVMKEVGAAKEKNRARAEEENESQELRCPEVGCERDRYNYKYKARPDKHIQRSHSEHEPAAKRRKVDSRVVGDGSQIRNGDYEDVEMAGTEEIK